MSLPGDGLHRALLQAGLLVSLGLVIEAVTLHWSHPTAFMLFLGLGALLVAAGIGRYLLALLSSPGSPPSPP